MNVYAIRHKPSGQFIEDLPPGQRRGGSHCEVGPGKPRILPTLKSAQVTLRNWLQGKFHANRGNDGMTGEFYEEITVTPQPHRIASDMEIVKFELVEVE